MSTHARPIPITSAASKSSPQETVLAFINAIEELDLDKTLALSAPNIRWVNAPLTTCKNKKQFETVMRGMLKVVTRFDVQIREIRQGTDGVVYTDRIDIIEGSGLAMELGVRGEFRVEDGLVTEWVDYFSWPKMLGAMARSIPAMIRFRLKK